jgi:hypothetical protein
VTGETPADERLALVRRTWELYNAGEVDAALETFHPDVLGNAGTYHGRDGFLQGFEAGSRRGTTSPRDAALAVASEGERE